MTMNNVVTLQDAVTRQSMATSRDGVTSHNPVTPSHNPTSKWHQLEIEELTQRMNRMDLPTRRKFMQTVRHWHAQNMRSDFAAFARWAWDIVEPGNPIIWNWHMDAICQHLQAVSEGKIRRLLINIPPGHSKSLLVSVLWPVWNWLRRPQWRVLCASYALELAQRDSVKCRELIEDFRFQQTFRPKWSLSRSQNSKSRFKNTMRGERMCLSVGSRTTGFRGDCVLIDDPLNFSDAMSETKRPKVNTWLDQAASNRLNNMETGAIVIIMQRLHHEDVSGHILEQGGYEHLCLPSRFDPERRSSTSIGWSDPRTQKGELLFPAMFPQEILDIEEKRMGALAFAGQHQQIPTPEQGNLFQAYMFCRDAEGKEFWDYPSGQEVTRAYFSFDTALKTGTHNDFTAGCLAMECEDGYVYLYPLVLERLKVPEIEKRILLLWAHWTAKPEIGHHLEGCLIEEGVGTALIQYLDVHNIARKNVKPPSPLWTQAEWDLIRSSSPPRVLAYNSALEKEERAFKVVPMAANGRVRLVDTALSRQWLAQLMSFPVSGHDDAVDATSAVLERFMLSPDSFLAGERGMSFEACERED